MYMIDLSAIDKLIDFYGENCIVSYKSDNITLYELKEYFIDNNISCSLNNCIVDKCGICCEDRKIISVFDLRLKEKDDLMDL